MYTTLCTVSIPLYLFPLSTPSYSNPVSISLYLCPNVHSPLSLSSFYYPLYSVNPTLPFSIVHSLLLSSSVHLPLPLSQYPFPLTFVHCLLSFVQCQSHFTFVLVSTPSYLHLVSISLYFCSSVHSYLYKVSTLCYFHRGSISPYLCAMSTPLYLYPVSNHQ